MTRAVKPASVIDTVRELLWPQYLAERDKLRRIDNWYRWRHEDVDLPRTASAELRALARLSKTPWLGLVVSVVSQTMLVDGYKSPDDNANTSAWRSWQANRLGGRQVAIHRAALAYGYAFTTVLPGLLGDENIASIRGASPLDMQAVYADPAEDDWPMFALRVIRNQPGDRVALRVLDEANVYFLDANRDGNDVKFIEARPHNVGVTPVVRYANQLDLEGRTPGEVEPFIPIAARINKTDYDRMLTQHFASWQIRYATGMAKPETDAETAAAKLRLRQDDFLIAEDPDTKFGTLAATPLDGFIRAHETDIETLAAVTQTPTNALTGAQINLSAEALAAARAQLDQKAAERKVAFGESHAQTLRLAAAIEGNVDAASDVMARVTWQDMSIRSMAQAVDALGKAAQMLSVPVQALWPMIPGVSKADVDDWKSLALQGDPITALQDMLDRQAASLDATQSTAQTTGV